MAQKEMSYLEFLCLEIHLALIAIYVIAACQF